MKQLEEKIKDKLDGYESNLPEGDLAEFKVLLDSAGETSAGRKTAYLAWLVPSVVAAGLALFFVLGRSPEADITIVR